MQPSIVKIAHLADCHLRSHQYGYRARGDDFFNGLFNAVRAAVQENVQAIICAGDLLDIPKPSSKLVVTQLSQIHAYLVLHKIPMYVISGNHDYAEPSWIELHAMNQEQGGLKCLDYRHIQLGDVRIYGAPYLEAPELREHLATADLADVDVFVWHGEVKEFCGYPKQNSIEFADLIPYNFQLVAMGDQHIHKLIVQDGLTIAYPGSTELCSESEDPQKYIYVHEFHDRKLVDSKSVPFVTRSVQKFILATEIDVEQAMVEINPEAIIYVDYAADLQNIRPRLNTVINEQTIIRTRPILSVGMQTGNMRQQIAESIISPAAFMQTHIKKVLADDEIARLGSLCTTFMDPAADHRLALDKYCEQQLGGEIII